MNLQRLIELLPYILMLAWLVFSTYYIIRAWRKPYSYNQYIFDSIPQIFPTIGILGTFMGIAWGLWAFDENNIEKSIPRLLGGLKTAFLASIAGIVFLIIFSKLTAIVQRKNDKNNLSPELMALNKLIELIAELKYDMNANLSFTDENNESINPADLFKEIYLETKKLATNSEKLNKEITDKIEVGFKEMKATQEEMNAIPVIKKLNDDIEFLILKVGEFSLDKTQKVVDDLENLINQMIKDFRESILNMPLSDIEKLSKQLSQTGESLADFPKKFQAMMYFINDNFKKVQEMIQNISNQTIANTTESTEALRRQVDEMNEILKNMWTTFK